MLIFVNNRLERYTGHCVSFCTHPGEGTARGKWRGCATGRRGDMGTWVRKKKQRRDTRTQPQAQKQGWHCFFLIYTSSPGDFVTSMASGINCNGWFLCLYTQPWKLGSSCLYPTASKNIHQLIHSLLCPRIKSSSQNLHNFPMFLNSTLAWTPSS